LWDTAIIYLRPIGPGRQVFPATPHVERHFNGSESVRDVVSVQAELVKLPPVVTLFAALIFGLLLGPIGVLLAAPLTVVLLVAVNCFYIEDVLGGRRVWPPVAGAGSP
jgi:hypothetical protein